MEEIPFVRWVVPEDVFNLPLYESYLVIDTRSSEAFARGRIATAVTYPSPCNPHQTEEEREKTLYDFAKGYSRDYIRPENANPVVIYGDDSTEHAQWLAKKLLNLQKHRKSLSLFSSAQVEPDEEQVFDALEQFCHTVADRVKEIWLLTGGYEAFNKEYPFLCGIIEPSDMFPVPHQIMDGLFLGSRVVPLTRHCLSQMAITHIIAAKHQELDARELETVTLLQCATSDSNAEEMFPCWTACCKFIDEALKQRGCVLVILHGRSRSASVILAYLIKTLRLDFDTAWTTLTKKCWHLIDRSLVYEQQLRAWQISKLQSITQ